MILIFIDFHFLCISEYETMLVQVGSFHIPFSLFKTLVNIHVVSYYYIKYTAVRVNILISLYR